MADPNANWTKVRNSSGDVLWLAAADIADFPLAGDVTGTLGASTLPTWSAWTPALAQGAVPTMTVQYARYVDIGKTRHAQAYVTATSAGTAATTLTLSLPAGTPAGLIGLVIGEARVQTAVAAANDLAATVAFASVGSTPTVRFLRSDANAPAGNIGVDPAAAIQNGDIVRCAVAYELA